MDVKSQASTCSEHYNKWKSLALSSRTPEDSRKCLEKAFFWLELQTAFLVLFALEKTRGSDSNAKEKIMLAKARLCKKLAEYAKQTLNEIGG